MVTMGRFCVFVIIALTGCGGDTKNRCEAVADDNPCTIETCVDDTPAVDFAPADTACGTALSCDGAGHCVQCTAAGQCPGTDDECQARTCATGGMCGFAYAAQGTARTQQTAGDCTRAVCDGAGGTSSESDDADAPADDGNPCTSEVCDQGAPAHVNLPIGTSCGTGVKCDGNASCVECLAANDCPATGNECMLRDCSAQGTCGTNPAPFGTALSTQASGDCSRAVCDGTGGPTAQDDDLDVPADDGNPCTSDTCSQGSPIHPFLPTGTSCGTSLKCDGSGSCVECLSETECPPPANECVLPTCTSGTCGTSFAPNGMSCGTPGMHCNGAGVCT